MITAKKIIETFETESKINDFSNLEFIDLTELYHKFEKLTLEQTISILSEVKNHNEICYNFTEYFVESWLANDFRSEDLEKDLQTILFPKKAEQDENPGNDFFGKFIETSFENNEEKIAKLKTKLNPHVTNWIEKEIPEMDIEEFNIAIAWIYKQKFGNG